MQLRIPFLCVLVCGALCACSSGPAERGATAAPAAAPGSDASADADLGGSGSSLVQVPAEQRGYLAIEAIEPQDDFTTAQAPGRVEFRESAVSSLGAPVAGKVVKVHARDGELVHAGDPVVTLYSPAAAAARADLARAESAARTAEDLLARQNDAVARGVGLEVERVEARAKRDEARVELERAKGTALQLGPEAGEEVVVRAPIDGTVLRIRATIGATVDPGGEPLAELGNPSALWVVAQVSEEDLETVRPGNSATVVFGPSRASLDGHVVAVGAAPEQDQRRIPVYVDADGPESPLRPGMYVRVALHSPSSAVLSVPASAIVIKDGRRSLVYVERGEGRFEPREVTAGRSDSERVRILSGLSPGERVVVRGALLLDSAA